MKKKIVVSVAILLAMLVVFGTVLICFRVNFVNKIDWILGKSSKEIEEKYGEFDRARTPPDLDGVYKSAVCSYCVKEEHIGFLGTTPPWFFSISFDENGVAYKCFFKQGGEGG